MSTKQMTRTYGSDTEFKRDQEYLQQQGWKVQSVSQHKEPFKAGKGCCLGIIFLPLALFARGKTKIVVVYEHTGKA